MVKDFAKAIILIFDACLRFVEKPNIFTIICFILLTFFVVLCYVVGKGGW